MTTRSCRWGAGRGHYDPWIDVYKTALLETNWSIIEERIQAADSAINARLHESSLNHGGSPEENQRIEDAIAQVERSAS